jgi:2'-5' RNA ligase
MTQTLYTVSFPELGDADRDFVERFRQQHDLTYRNVLPAHFTMVFGVRDMDVESYIEHVRDIARSARPFSFTCRYAMFGADMADDTAYIALVPDEGYSSLSLLHDRLYGGPLERHHKLELPYVPHITIGRSRDRREAKDLCGHLNESGLMIAGRISSLTVGALENDKFSNLQRVALTAV